MGQIDLRSMSLAHRILTGCAAVLFIVMFFTWQGVSSGRPSASAAGTG